MYEWSQYDEKEKSSKLTKNNSLELENKSLVSGAITYMELPYSLNDDDFVVNLLMGKTSIKSDKTFGILFNYKNERNYALLRFDEKQASIIECEKGEAAVVKRTLYKVNDFTSDLIKSDLEYIADKNNIVVTIERKNTKLSFYINGVYICSMQNYKIEYPTFGFVAIGKNTLNVFGLEFAKASTEDTEE